MHPTCIYCGQGITAENDSDEHVISKAIGGRRTVRGLLHLACNNKAGQSWDAALEKQLRPLALHFGVKRQYGKTLRMAITTTAGEDFLLGSGGTLEMARPDIKRTRTADGENIRVVAGSFAMARQVLEGEKRKNPHIDVEGVLASAEVRRSYAQGVVHLDFAFGGELSGRSLVKSALALAHNAGIPTGRCGDALNYLRDANGEPCFGYYYVHDLVADRPAGLPLHCVAIEATPASGLILGYVEFFGVHRAVVCLGRCYTGDVVKRVYALDLRSGTELEMSVRLDFDEADIKAIYNYERDDDAGRQNAFGNVFDPGLRAQNENERNRVFDEALSIRVGELWRRARRVAHGRRLRQYPPPFCRSGDALATACDGVHRRGRARRGADFHRSRRATPWLQ